MKVKFKYGIGCFAGTIDEATYSFQHSGTASIMRKWVMPTLTENNTLLGTVSTNLSLVWKDVSQDWKDDLATYSSRYFTEHLSDGDFDPVKSRYAHWLQIMYAWQADDPSHVDLTTITMGDIETLGTKFATVKAAVENGFLPAISDFDDLTGAI